MSKRTDWTSLRDDRMREPGAREAYQAVQLAYELGRRIRQLREDRGWSQSELARAARMSQPSVARFEAGGTIPTIPVVGRLARALGAELIVQVEARPDVA